MYFPAFLQQVTVLQCYAKLPQGEYYIIITPQILGWTGLETKQTSLLKQPTPASNSWSRISSSYSIFLLTLFSVSTWQSVSLHAFLLWKSGDLREILPTFDQIHKSWSRLLQKAKPMLCSIAFFQALSQPFTRPNSSLSSRAVFCNSFRKWYKISL